MSDGGAGFKRLLKAYEELLREFKRGLHKLHKNLLESGFLEAFMLNVIGCWFMRLHKDGSYRVKFYLHLIGYFLSFSKAFI